MAVIKNYITLLLIGLIFLPSCKEEETSTPVQTGSLSEIIQGNDDFSLLADALVASGLMDTLQQSNIRITVMAPNNDAFEAWFQSLGVSNISEAQTAVGTENIRQILKYHMVSGLLETNDWDDRYVPTLAFARDDRYYSAYLVESDLVSINEDIVVLEKNIIAENGVVHEIGSIMDLPNVFDLVAMNPNLADHESAIILADGNLAEYLGNPNNTFTHFAPTNKAFQSLIDKTPGVDNMVNLVTHFGTDSLEHIVRYHSISGDILKEDLATGNIATLFVNYSLFININNDVLEIIDNQAVTDNALIETQDVTGTNGTLHVVSQVLLP